MDHRFTVHPRLLRCPLWAAVLITSAFTCSFGFDDKQTHPLMTDLAVGASKLDLTLKTALGVTNGKDVMLQPASGLPRSVLGWLQAGSDLEDNPPCRASNHFHNPLKEYPAAGVTDLPVPIRTACAAQGFSPIRSSATWGTKYISPTQKETRLTTNNGMDWDIARAAYFDALTKGTPAERDQHLAKTFQALGQVLHLIQDLAVPAHVRDDFASHEEYFEPGFTSPIRWWANDFERYVKRNSALIAGGQSLDPNSFASQPVTRFWDTGQYRQTTTPSLDFAQGLAEYTSANFFSQNTPFTDALPATDPRFFPHPARANTTLPQLLSAGVLPRQVYAEDGIPDTVLYVEQVQGPGEPSLLLAKAGFFHKPILAKDSLVRTLLPLGFQLDDQVLAAYATRLLPRAVAYSAGLLDYFFRGDLNFQVTLDKDETGATAENPRPPYRFALVIQNLRNDPMVGDFFLYADTGDSDAPDSWHRDLVVAKNLALSRAGEGGSTYPMPSQVPFFFTPPADLKRLILVFKGTLGVETDYAVAAKVKAWQMPVAFAVQESAELLGDTVREENLLAYPNKEIRLYNAAGRQRVTGNFAVRGTALTGKDIQRIAIEGNWGGSLRIDGMPSGSVWVRGNADAPDPVRWEIVTDFDASTYSWAGDARAYLPTTLTVETVAGFTTKTPLALWLWVASSGRRWCPGGGNFSGYEHCTYVWGVVFYGDGNSLGYDPITTPPNYAYFPSPDRRIPITTPGTFVGFVPVGVGGNPVGVMEDASGDAVFDDERFAWRSDGDRYWDKNRFKFYLHKGLDDTIAAPEPEPISPPPTVQVKRFYFPEELTAFGRLGVQPPDNDAVITLQ